MKQIKISEVTKNDLSAIALMITNDENGKLLNSITSRRSKSFCFWVSNKIGEL